MKTIIEPFRIKSVVPLRPCATLLERLASPRPCSGSPGLGIATASLGLPVRSGRP